MPAVKAEQAAVGFLTVLGGLVLFAALRKSGGLAQPASVTESGWNVIDPQQPNLTAAGGIANPDQIFTPHRYPRVCGGELTTVIHYGHSRLTVPHERDRNWIVNPPSEAII